MLKQNLLSFEQGPTVTMSGNEFENEKIIIQFVWIIKYCNQSGDWVSKSKKDAIVALF